MFNIIFDSADLITVHTAVLFVPGIEHHPAHTKLDTLFCGCRPVCKKNPSRHWGDREHASVRPLCAALYAAGRYSRARAGSKSAKRAFKPGVSNWLSQPRSFDHLPIQVVVFSHLMTPLRRVQIAHGAAIGWWHGLASCRFSGHVVRLT